MCVLDLFVIKPLKKSSSEITMQGNERIHTYILHPFLHHCPSRRDAYKQSLLHHTMRGFIVDETYRIEEGVPYVYLFGRLENGESFLTITLFKPYFCIKEEDRIEAEKITSTKFTVERTVWKTMDGEPVVKVILENPKEVPGLRESFEKKKIRCFEADIRFTQRFLIDHNILRSLRIEGEFEKSDFVDRVYRDPAIYPDDWYPALRTLSFDIETSPDAGKLYSISLVCEDPNATINEVLIVGKKTLSLERAKVFPDEKSLIEHFRNEVIRIDPDIITGWNTIDFDLSVLRKKFQEHKVPFRMARQDWDCTLRVESSFMKESTAEFPGRQTLDGIQMLKLNFISLTNYKLGTAAKELLGEKKLIEGDNRGHDIEQAYRSDPQKLVDYNLKDSQLVLDILAKTNAIDIMINRSMLTGMSLDRVRGSIASFDSLYLRELRKRGFVAPSGAFSEKEEGIAGGYVMESKPGIYENIIVCDFKSLYPSLMRTFNIDPLAFARGKKLPKTKAIVAPNDVQFSREEGILPELLTRFWHARDDAKKRKDLRASAAIKILMNSFFGVLASPACRFYSLEMAGSITAFARHFIQRTIKRVEEMGHDVLYGDTDSIFFKTDAKTYEEAERIAQNVAHEITESYRKEVKEEYDRESHMELQAEKIFVHFIMPKMRGSDEGAKKRYAGIVRKGGKEELVVTGLEIVRRDWTDLAKEYQERLLNLVFEKKDPTEYTKQFVKDLKDGKLDDKLVYRKAIRKDLAGYTKTTPPHVKAARLLEEEGVPLDSHIIEYVLTKEGPWPILLTQAGKKQPTIDYDHYIDKQLKPIGDGILVFYDTSFDDLLKGSSQKTLFGF